MFPKYLEITEVQHLSPIFSAQDAALHPTCRTEWRTWRLRSV